MPLDIFAVPPDLPLKLANGLGLDLLRPFGFRVGPWVRKFCPCPSCWSCKWRELENLFKGEISEGLGTKKCLFYCRREEEEEMSSNSNSNSNPNPWRQRQSSQKEEEYYASRAWGLLLFGLIGATATTLAVSTL